MKKWLAPTFVALLFLVHPLVVLTRPDLPLQDPGTGWLLKAGQLSVETGKIQDRDTFSYSVPGGEWMAHKWLFYFVMGRLEKAGGIPLVSAFFSLLYALLPVLVYRRLVRVGCNMGAALFVAFLAYLILLMHALARPHVFTYLFLALSLDALDRIDSAAKEKQGWCPSPSVLAWLAVMMAVWSNLHGGFVVALVVVGIYFCVAAAEAFFSKEGSATARAKAFAVALCVMVVASFANPFGWGPHMFVLEYLSKQSIQVWHEFAPPDFRNGGSSVKAFELYLLLLIALSGWQGRRMRWTTTELALALFFTHYALNSLRQVNFFAIVMAPVLGRMVSDALEQWLPRFAARWDAIAKNQSELKGTPLYLGVFSLGFVLLSQSQLGFFKRDLDDIHLSRASREYIAAHSESFHRMFNTDDVGGTLIYYFCPKLQVFMDDRDYYPEPFVLEKYFPLRYGRAGWDVVLDEFQITSAVVNRAAPIGVLLESSGRWVLAHEDEKNKIYLKK